jgi:hypothetical protein
VTGPSWWRRLQAEPETLPFVALVPATFLLLGAGVTRAWPLAALSAGVMLAALVGESVLRRRTSRDIQRQFYADSIDDRDRNTRRPPEGTDPEGEES